MFGLFKDIFGKSSQSARAEAVVTPTGAGSFKMVVEDIFAIGGRGVVLTGTVEQGSVSVGDSVMVNEVSAVVSGVEAFNKQLTSVSQGQSAGILFTDLSKEQVPQGAVITK